MVGRTISSGSNMSWGGGVGRGLDQRRYAEVMRDKIVHKEQPLERGSGFTESSSPKESSLKHNTRRGSIYILIGIIVVALLIGLIWFAF